MNVFYEEDGSFKVGAVLADNNSSLQVEAPHGKRSKIKSNAVLLHFEQPSLPEFMPLANNVAEEIDTDFLWECSPQAEFSFEDLALEYFGARPRPVEAAGVLIRLHTSPVHFYKKGRGHYKAAPPESLKSALAAIEKRKLQAAELERLATQLASFTLPEEFRPHLQQLLYAPDKNTLIYKALEAARAATQMTVPRLLEKCGALPSAHDYHFDRFLFEFFPNGVAFPDFPEFRTKDSPESQVPDDLPLAEVGAFSIDDTTTTEIDDAFSVAALPAGGWRVGIHIAAPALGFSADSTIDAAARQRLSTVYMPGRKITMLPEHVVQPFSLTAGEVRPVLSLYLNVAADYSVLTSESRLEKVNIAANLRHDSLEALFNEASIANDEREYPFAGPLRVLWHLANRLEQDRGKSAVPQNSDYSFYVENDRISIVERRRGSPVDKVVAEMMIFANAEWGRQLAEHGIAAIYRAQGNGKVKMTTEPQPHQGLGVAQYVWASSPLRRYIDLINQRQLISWIAKTPVSYSNHSDELLTAMRDFDLTYAAYGDFQKTMERYWCLRWLLQENVESSIASVVRENLIKLAHVPLYVRAPSLPDLNPGTEVEVEVSQIDLFELTVSCRFVRKTTSGIPSPIT
ncbi:MAG: ribonuclease catalytic domain-containing protein [Burkholderiales bacterium]